MKHMQVLKRAWHILWNYRALWVFGIILALTTTAPSGTQTYQLNDQDWEQFRYEINAEEPILPQLGEASKQAMEEVLDELNLILSDEYEDELAQAAVQAVLWFMGVMIVLAIAGRVLYYVAQVSAIKMVDDYEETNQTKKVGEGFRLGWSVEAWRIFLADLVIELPYAAAVLTVVGLVLLPIFVWSGDNTTASLVSLLTAIGLSTLLGLVLLAVRVVLYIVKPIIRREIALNQVSVGQGLRGGFRMARKYWKETGLMGLILFGIRIVWPLVTLPVTILSLMVSGAAGVGTALLIGGEAFTTGDPAMIWAIFTGLAIFVIVLLIPLGFINGLRETYFSSSWTLTYRELAALSALENGNGPAVEALPEAS